MLIHRRPLSKDDPPTKEAGEETVHGPLLPTIGPPEQDHQKLVQAGKLGQIKGVVARGSEDELELFPWGAPAEEKGHDEGVREADLGTVDGSIAGGLGVGVEQNDGEINPAVPL